MNREPRIYKDNYIDVNSVKTRFWEAGDKEPPIVFVHGLGSFIEAWIYLFEDLSYHYKVYAFDLIGFGKTGKPEGEYTYAFFAKFVYDFMMSVGIEKAHIIGWSLGGGTALQFTIDHPELIEKLILIASGGLSRKFTLALRILTVPFLGEKMASPSSESSYNSFKHMVYDPRIIQENWIDRHYRMTSSPGAKKAALRTLRAGSTVFGGKRKVLNPIIKNLGSIKAETLIVWGKQDRVIPLECAYIAEKKIPRTELFLIDECGHAPPLEYPDLLTKRIIRFLHG